MIKLSIMNSEDIQEKIFIFERNLNEECYTYGWGRGLRRALNLYEENLNLEEENDILYYKMDKYKKASQRLQKIVDSEIKDVMNDLTEKVIKNNEPIQSNKFIVKIHT